MWVIARACPYVPRSKQADTVFKSSASQTGALDFLQCFFRLLAPDNLRLAQLRAWQWVAGLICYATAGEPKVEKRNPRKNYRYVKRPRKFELSESSLWHTYLQENGYVILKGALSVRECRVALDLVFDYLEALDTGIDRHDPDEIVDEVLGRSKPHAGSSACRCGLPAVSTGGGRYILLQHD